ncbi:MAG TPA: ABC transporter substrate-binding protein [Oligoflexia bacterium]|nr:ABC transporter substrate-binding protein [Oligoflexia bacterium]HMP47950.1 ABC transporter substrate-binding protein [Oligoflexia bacterium]
MSIDKEDRFSTRSKNFLTKNLILLIVFSYFLLASCNSYNRRSNRPVIDSGSARAGSRIDNSYSRAPKAPLAPWEVWNRPDYSNLNLKSAYRYSEEGNLKRAEEEYLNALKSARNPEEAEIALLGVLSMQLKQGKTSDALSRISRYASLNGKTPEQLDDRFSLISAFAYIRSGDTNQSFAWLSQTYRSGRGTSPSSRQARLTGTNLIRSLSDEDLRLISGRWKTDAFVSSLVKSEELRRVSGEKQIYIDYSKWFIPETYSVFAISNTLTNDTANTNELPNVSDSDQLYPAYNYGVILPLSGVYQSHARKVLEGLELAFQLNLPSGNLFPKDSSLSPVQEIIRELHDTNSVRGIFGPLLVQDTEQVAPLCNSYHIPCISFAKKAGIPELGPAIFRLGASSDNQLEVLLNFADQKLGARRIILFYPNNQTGHEFSEAAEKVQIRGGRYFLNLTAYNPGSPETISEAVRGAIAFQPDALLIADTLNSSENLIRAIKTSEELGSRVILGTSLFSDQQEIKRYLDLLDGMYMVSLFNPESSRPAVRNFINEYQMRFSGRMPDLLAAQSFDAATLLIKSVVDNADERKGYDINYLINSQPYDGVTGVIRVLSSGEMFRDLPVLRLDRGMLVEIGN